MKTTDGEINVLSIEEIKRQVASLKPHSFDLAHDKVAFIVQKDETKDPHAATWCLRTETVIIFTNISRQLVPEFLVHELNELVIAQSICCLEEEAVACGAVLGNVTHYLSASSLGQYDEEVAAINPILNHILSDRNAEIGRSMPRRSMKAKQKTEKEKTSSTRRLRDHRSTGPTWTKSSPRRREGVKPKQCRDRRKKHG
jgi:hypothetical protein